MARFRQRFALSCAGCALVLAVGLVAWALAAGSSEAQQDGMHNCPQAGKWAISVWDGADATETGEALATCGEVTVDFAYYLDPEANGWLGYFEGHVDISQLLTLDDMQGIIAHGAMAAPVPTPTATPGTAGDVVLVSSNAFTTTSSILIDGESRRMHIVGEVRNESATARSAGEITIKVYDAANNVVGSRSTVAFDNIIMPGRTTAFAVTYPSFIYWSNETNDFPEGWTRYEISLSPHDPYSSEGLPINVTVHDVQASLGDYDWLYLEGTVRNDDSRPQKRDGDLYAILYDQQDKILNVSRISWPEELQPGQSTHFEVTLSYAELTDYSRYLVQAYAEAE